MYAGRGAGRDCRGVNCSTCGDFRALYHVLVQSAESSHDQLQELFRVRGVYRGFALDIPHFSVFPRILARTDLAAPLPLRIPRLFNDAGQVPIYEFPNALPLALAEVTLHWRQDFENDTGHRWLCEAITDLAHEMGRGGWHVKTRLPTRICVIDRLFIGSLRCKPIFPYGVKKPGEASDCHRRFGRSPLSARN
jgi:hypothetical protein